jgi:hypothetical protein
MKEILGILTILLIVFSSCSNEFELFDEKEDIPIVYGLLSSSDTAHYIRVERAFADPNGSALDIAMIPDSLYYNNAGVSILNVQTGQEFVMSRVDGNQEGYVRNQGVFAQAPNYLYKLHSSLIDLVPGNEYEFRLNRGETKALVTATTIVLEDPLVTRPTSSARIDFDYILPFTVKWRLPDGGKISDVRLIINYEETDMDQSGNPTTSHSLTWFVGRNLDTDEIERPGIEFYSFLANSLVADQNIIRDFDGIDVVVDVGGQEILDYIRVGQANIGITSSQDIPTYTNLSEGFGLFSSISSGSRFGISLTTESRDSLENGFITKDLNFQ